MRSLIKEPACWHKLLESQNPFNKLGIINCLLIELEYSIIYFYHRLFYNNLTSVSRTAFYNVVKEKEGHCGNELQYAL